MLLIFDALMIQHIVMQLDVQIQMLMVINVMMETHIVIATKHHMTMGNTHIFISNSMIYVISNIHIQYFCFFYSIYLV
ncbi:unnamed protein product [Adineta ricciae]|uniref:Uncharacterized protein n=1 Tax=Adineta ricciae TaxID=249248 RepID=A0A815X1P4_ADIRI|nr:unnamed protein product [Adineta ricciae]